jgi:hypothetical protein
MGVRPKGAGRLVCSLTGLHNQDLGSPICAFKRADHKKFHPCLRQDQARLAATGLFEPDQSIEAWGLLACPHA